MLGTAENGGWPCIEGPLPPPAFERLDLSICEGLYAAGPSAVHAPYYYYAHTAQVVPGELCPSGSTSISGIAFYQGGPYPAAYDGALFFADYSRDCIWAMRAGSGGLPDPADIVTFVGPAANPVALEIGPGGDLFYADFDGGKIWRIRYFAGNQPPTAVAEAINVAEQAQCPLEISHLKVDAPSRWGASAKALAMIDAARARGLRVNADQYLYDAASSNLGIRFPSWVLEGGQDKINERLDDPETWAKIRAGSNT